MAKDKTSVIILAAGKGTRMKSETPKVLFPLCGKPMLQHVIEAALCLDPHKIVVVVGYKAGEVMDTITREYENIPGYLKKIEFVVQKEQRGTGHAVNCTQNSLEQAGGDVLILCGDTPLITGELLKEFAQHHRNTRAHLSLITYCPQDPEAFGRIIRGKDGKMLKIVEARDLTTEQTQIREVNSGVYMVKAKDLYQLTSGLKDDNAKKEFYLTDMVATAVEKGMAVSPLLYSDPDILMGINNRWTLSQAEQSMRLDLLKKLALSGVTIKDPATTYIEAGVQVGRDSIIKPCTVIKGGTQIGRECIIGPSSEICDSVVGDRSQVWFSVVENSEIACDVQIGPYSHIRPGTVVEQGALIGNFAEVKNSVIGRGTKVHHHSYIGDSTLGKDVNIGAGTVTVNYDGAKKHRTVIEDSAFIGCNANLIAPVTIGKGAYVAAGSTITRRVPDKSLAIAREKQTNKEDWVAKKEKQTSR